MLQPVRFVTFLKNISRNRSLFGRINELKMSIVGDRIRRSSKREDGFRKRVLTIASHKQRSRSRAKRFRELFFQNQLRIKHVLKLNFPRNKLLFTFYIFFSFRRQSCAHTPFLFFFHSQARQRPHQLREVLATGQTGDGVHHVETDGLPVREERQSRALPAHHARAQRKRSVCLSFEY